MKKLLSFVLSLVLLCSSAALADDHLPEDQYVPAFVSAMENEGFPVLGEWEEYKPDDFPSGKNCSFKDRSASFHVMYDASGSVSRYEAQIEATTDNHDIVYPIVFNMIRLSSPAFDDASAKALAEEIISDMPESDAFDAMKSATQNGFTFTLRQDYTSYDAGFGLMEWYYLIFDVDPEK